MLDTKLQNAAGVQPPGGRVAPGPRSKSILGGMPRSGDLGMLGYYLDNWREYGDIVRFRVGPITQHLVVQPDHIRHVLVTNRQNYTKGIGMRKLKLLLGQGLFTSEGALWQRQRKLMQPPFTPKGVQPFGPDMTAAIASMLDEWAPRAARGEAFDVYFEMMRLALGIIARTMLSIEARDLAGDTAQAFTHVLEYITRHSMTVLDVPRFIPTRENRNFNRALAMLDALIDRVIAERRADPNPPDDLLTLLLNARDENGAPLSHAQIRAEVMTIFFAGHETTALALTWAWYLLSQNPGPEEKLQGELDRVLQGRTPTVADLPALTYTNYVLQEAMRLYPPAAVFVRDALGPDEIGAYAIPKGSMIMLSPFITHRHAAFWDDPESFDPDRFSPKRSAGRHPYAYFPFGAGARKCIGNNFTMEEGALALAMIAQRFRLRLAPGAVVRPHMLGTLRPLDPLMMCLEPRG